MNKRYYTYNDVHDAVNSIALQMYKDMWRPDYIVGLNRGGLPLSVILSHQIDCNHYTLDVRLRDGGEQCPESNCWMAEDAFGYVSELDRDGIMENVKSNSNAKKNILIVDDINDTGATFNWIKKDWQSSCLPNDSNWNTIWGQNVRFATMTENLSSEFGEVKYYWDEVNKTEEDVWLVWPWELNKGKK